VVHVAIVEKIEARISFGRSSTVSFAYIKWRRLVDRGNGEGNIKEGV